MHKYKANAATDVTGFGLLGHASNLAKFQKNLVQFVITKLPIIKNVLKFGEVLSLDKKLRSGTAVETSGGLLISLPAKAAVDFCEDYKRFCGTDQSAWIIGYVGERASTMEATAIAEEPIEFIEAST